MENVYSLKTFTKKPLTFRLGSWAMHPAWGVLTVMLILYMAYWFVGLLGAGTIVDFFETGLFAQYLNPAFITVFDWILPFEHSHLREVIDYSFTIPLTSSREIDTGIHLTREVIVPAYEISPDITLNFFENIFKFLHDFLVGEYGVITMALTYGFAIVFPIVGTFFILFSVLEDTGYLPRLAVMLNRIFKSIGLNGKAILPMVLGLGCDTMATMTTRIMETRKERIIVTLLLALGIPCSAQLGVLLAMVSHISVAGVFLWLGVVSGVLIFVGFASSKLLKGESSAFILEIPPIRRPQISNILIKTAARMEWYFREVIPLFIIGTMVLFFLDFFALLNIIRAISSPLVVTFLGLPAETTEAFLIGFLRRDYGAVYLFDAMTQGLLTPNQILIAMITITLFVPCIANVFIIIKELGIKVALRVTLFIFPFAFLVGGFLHFLLKTFNIQL
ncbi:nucleoside recognition domain-containing protein [candidate division KSB1 bacterium]